jgi:hypothetical protein
LRRRRQPAYEAGSWPARRRCKRPTDEDPSCGGSTLPLPYSGGHAHHAKLSSPGRASVAARRGRSSLLARRLRSATVEVGRGGLDLRRRAARARLVSSVPGASCLLLRPQRQPMWIWRRIYLARARLTRDPARWRFEKTASTTRGSVCTASGNGTQASTQEATHGPSVGGRGGGCTKVPLASTTKRPWL